MLAFNNHSLENVSSSELTSFNPENHENSSTISENNHVVSLPRSSDSIRELFNKTNSFDAEFFNDHKLLYFVMDTTNEEIFGKDITEKVCYIYLIEPNITYDYRCDTLNLQKVVDKICKDKGIKNFLIYSKEDINIICDKGEQPIEVDGKLFIKSHCGSINVICNNINY